MTVYLDASVLVALFTNDALTPRADAFLRSKKPAVLVSDFAAAEFSSAIARRVRMKELSRNEAQSAFSTFDMWTAQAARRVTVAQADMKTTESLLRRLDLALRTPDALNLAIVQRLGVALASFDEKMVAAARKLHLSVAKA